MANQKEQPQEDDVPTGRSDASTGTNEGNNHTKSHPSANNEDWGSQGVDPDENGTSTDWGSQGEDADDTSE